MASRSVSKCLSSRARNIQSLEAREAWVVAVVWALGVVEVVVGDAVAEGREGQVLAVVAGASSLFLLNRDLPPVDVT